MFHHGLLSLQFSLQCADSICELGDPGILCLDCSPHHIATSFVAFGSLCVSFQEGPKPLLSVIGQADTGFSE